MPPRRKSTPQEKVQAAVRHLNEAGQPDLAQAVAENAAPGWSTRPPKDENVPLWLEVALKQRALAAAEASGRPVADVVREGLRAFVDGRFRPAKPKRAARGTAPQKTTLTVRAGAALCQSASAYAAEHADDLGWEPKPSQVAVAYLAAQYPPPEQDDAAE